jgi:predicted ATPase/class 3 adenylate cyclase
MVNLIPHFIAEKLEKKELSGSFQAYTLFLDISGFTKMTEALMEKGKKGAESLSKIINSVFDPVLKDLYAAGGFVSTFAGDAFTALIPLDETNSVNVSSAKLLDLVKILMSHFSHNPIHKTLWGDFLLEAKIGLAKGRVDWGIMKYANHKSYFFSGEAIDFAALAEHHCQPGQIAFHTAVNIELSDLEKQSAESTDEYSVFKPGLEIPKMENPLDPPKDLDLKLLAPFIPTDKLPQSSLGEFRTIASVFVSFDDKKENLNTLFNSMSQLAQENGAYFNLLDFGDKGGIALFLFGAPSSVEDRDSRALQFASLLSASHNQLKIGVASGRAFTGFVGSNLRSTYTALGRVVNLSARLAIASLPGTVLTPVKDYEQVQEQFEFDTIEEKEFKGFSKAIKVRKLLSAKQKLSNSFKAGIGRKEEIQQVSEWILEAEQKRRTQGISILGEVGMGKTQLMADVKAHLNAQNPEIEVLEFSFDPLFQKSFTPFQNYFKEQLLEYRKLSASELDVKIEAKIQSMLNDSIPDYLENEIRRAKPVICYLGGLSEGSTEFVSLDFQAQRDLTIEALTAYFSLLSLNKPLVMVLEQSQVIDEASREFISRLVSRGEDLPLSLIYLVRGNRTPELPGTEDRIIHLSEFSAADLAEAAKQSLGFEADEKLLDFLSRRTDNIPLYVFELLRYVQEKKLVVISKHKATLREYSQDELPPSLEDLLISEIDSFPAKIKAVLPRLAVLGNNFPHELLKGLFGKQFKSLETELQKLGVLREFGEDRIGFQKETLREAVYALQLDDKLKELHAEAARVWENMYPDPDDFSQEKAYHFHLANMIPEARSYYNYAARFTSKNYLNEEAIKMFQQAIDLSEEDDEKALLRLEMAKVHEVTGDRDSALRELERGIGLAALSGKEDLYHKYFALLGKIQMSASNFTDARKYFEKAIREPRNRGISEALVGARIDLARVLIFSGEYGDALSRLYEARDLAIEKSMEKEEGLALYYIGQILNVRNRSDEALQAYERSLALFRKLKLQRQIANPLYDLANMSKNQGQLDRSRAQFQEVLKIYVQIGYKSGLAATLLNLGSIEDQLGDFSKARDFFRRSRNIAEEVGEELAVAFAQFSLGASAYKAGELTQALSYLLDAHQLIEKLGVETYLGYTNSYLVSTLVRMGRADEAIERALDQIRINFKHGDDPEKGRIFLSLAELVEKSLPFSQESKEKLREIGKLAKINKINPTQFYRLAITSSRESNYVNTLISALFHFGEFLISRGKEETAGKYIKQSWDLSKKSGWNNMLERLKKKYPQYIATEK